jgi:hypothetical protein
MDGKRAFAVRVFSTLLVAAWIVSAAMSTRLACAQDADGAKRFVESLYRQYDHHGPGVDFSGAKGRNVFDASLNALMDADAKAVGPNEVGVLDGDPICGCQDWEGIWDLQIALQMLGESRAKAAVSFALFAPKTTSKARADRDLRSLEMTLKRESSGWRIDNIVDKSDPKAQFDLRAELEKESQDLKQTRRTKSRRP